MLAAVGLGIVIAGFIVSFILAFGIGVSPLTIDFIKPTSITGGGRAWR